MEELKSEDGEIRQYSSYDEWLDESMFIVASYNNLEGGIYYRLMPECMESYQERSSSPDIPQCDTLGELLTLGGRIVKVEDHEEWDIIKSMVEATYTVDQQSYHCAIKQEFEDIYIPF